jgi:GWxTD domain-containing protein
MKIRPVLLILATTLPMLVMANRTISADFTYGVYKSPQQGTYVETWLSIDASSVKYVQLPTGKYRAEVDVVMIFSQSGEVVNFLKYQLSSPEIDDTVARTFGFLDQQRVLLENGVYDLEISLKDLHRNIPAAETSTVVEVQISDSVALSSLQLIDRAVPTENASSISRGGYDLFPDFHAFYPESKELLTFYSETYHTQKMWGSEEGFLHRAWIESFESGTIVNDQLVFKREKTGVVVPFLHSFNIADLPSGNYHLVVEVRDKMNQQVARRQTFFQRSNPLAQLRLEDIAAIELINTFSVVYTDIDSLSDYIKSCFPIANEGEMLFARNLLQLKDLKHMQQFLYHFWSVRTPADPKSGWLNYKRQVERVNASYGTHVKRGYETDRGIMWLRYGEPNTIYRSTHEPEAYPYEIWHYYRLNHNQSNRKFVFVNFGIGVGDFEVAHSNVIGEFQDSQWHLKLHARHVSGSNVDRTEYDTNYGSRALEIFNNPY